MIFYKIKSFKCFSTFRAIQRILNQVHAMRTSKVIHLYVRWKIFRAWKMHIFAYFQTKSAYNHSGRYFVVMWNSKCVKYIRNIVFRYLKHIPNTFQKSFEYIFFDLEKYFFLDIRNFSFLSWYGGKTESPDFKGL